MNRLTFAFWLGWAATALCGLMQGAEDVPSATHLLGRDIRAQVIAVRQATLAAEIGAKVLAFPLPEGGSFREGDLLVRLDSSLQEAQCARAQAEFDAAQALFKANSDLQRLNSVGQLELEQSRAALQRAEAELKASRALLERCEIKAPFDGRIAEKKVRELEFVQPGQALLEILDCDQLELEFIIPSRWLQWLRVDQPFEVAIDETGRTYPATILRVGAKVDAVSQTAKVAGRIVGGFPELLPGMSGKVTLSPADAGPISAPSAP